MHWRSHRFGLGRIARGALRKAGQFEFFVSMSYVVFLGSIGTLMMIESVSTLRKAKTSVPSRRAGGHEGFIHALPLKMRFHRSKLYMSAIPPLGIGAFIGLLSAVMGGGGGLRHGAGHDLLAQDAHKRRDRHVAVQSRVRHRSNHRPPRTTNQNVDIVLAFLLMIGAVTGAEFGASAGQHLRGEQLRFLLAAIVLLVSGRIAYDLVATPADIYSTVFHKEGR